MRVLATLLVVALLLFGTVGLVGCSGDEAEDTPSSSEEETSDATDADTDSEPTGAVVVIAAPEDVAGTWTGNWFNQYSTNSEEPEVWAEGAIVFNEDGTHVSNFTPVTDEPPVEIANDFTIGTDFELTTITIHGRPYYAKIEGNTLTLTAYADDGTADASPTFVLMR